MYLLHHLPTNLYIDVHTCPCPSQEELDKLDADDVDDAEDPDDTDDADGAEDVDDQVHGCSPDGR